MSIPDSFSVGTTGTGVGVSVGVLAGYWSAYYPAEGTHKPLHRRSSRMGLNSHPGIQTDIGTITGSTSLVHAGGSAGTFTSGEARPSFTRDAPLQF